MTFCRNFENVLEEIIDVLPNLKIVNYKVWIPGTRKIILKDLYCKFNDNFLQGFKSAVRFLKTKLVLFRYF